MELALNYRDTDHIYSPVTLRQFYDNILRIAGYAPSSDMIPPITKVIYNPPATIVMWADNTKTVVKATNEDYDPEKGLAMAIAKKALGNKGNYYNVIKKWVDKYDEPSLYPSYSVPIRKLHVEIEASVRKACEAKWFAYQSLQNALHDKKATKADLLAAMEEASGYLGEVLDD